MSSRPPNLLVIMCDQLRATALGLYGNETVRTPHIESLAQSGTTYQYGFTPSPVCVPARVALWTGRWPHLTRSMENSVFLQPGETHLLQLLRERGYRTGLIGKNHCFSDEDLASYFDTYFPVSHQGPAGDLGDPEIAAGKRFIRTMNNRADVPTYGASARALGGAGRGGAGGKAYACGVSPYPVEKHGTWLIGREAERFIRHGSQDRPFCAWVSIADPHTPYQISEPYASRYPAESLDLPPHDGVGYPGKPQWFRLFAELMGAHDVSDEHLKQVLSIYYGMIALIDDVVGRLLAALDETGQREDTIVLFTADHGDYMTEHRLVRKGASMADALTRIPFLLSYPARITAGQTSDSLVSLLDVFPTLCSLMNVPLPPGRSGHPLHLAVEGAARREVVFSEHGVVRGAINRDEIYARLERMAAAGRPHNAPWQLAANGQKKMVRTRDWKYVWHAGRAEELYDLRTDRHELTNLAPRSDQRERLDDFRARLLEWCIETEEIVPEGGRGGE
ncbi:MAG TPA: sulfatase-like hydrolase/transferase [Chloroflexota bacterium]|nr:sulfatase-like hydrolase/transferase [Chloroflexota bacterium]